MYKVELDKFQGPLDLLLYFIRRDELDINDIPIAEITAEYLQIIEDMKAMNLSIAGEFILMAATLMRIKSKMLIPRAELDDLGEPIDPRTELVQQLIEYKKYKDIADNLSEKWERLSYQHERSFSETFQDTDVEDIDLFIKHNKDDGTATELRTRGQDHVSIAEYKLRFIRSLESSKRNHVWRLKEILGEVDDEVKFVIRLR